jgi:hypothetical protein
MAGIRVGSCNPSNFVSGYSYHMSVRTGLPDHTMQTKFQSQRPSDDETTVPSIWVQKLSSIKDSQYLDGWPPYGFVLISKEKADQLISCWRTVLYHIVRNWSNAMHWTTPAYAIPCTWMLASWRFKNTCALQFSAVTTVSYSSVLLIHDVWLPGKPP